MADRTWQIEHRGEFRLVLRRATSLPRGNKRDYVSYKTLVRWRFACALRGSARGFWFIDPLGLRPSGLCTVATRACHVNHAPPSYNYNIDHAQEEPFIQFRYSQFRFFTWRRVLHWYPSVLYGARPTLHSTVSCLLLCFLQCYLSTTTTTEPLLNTNDRLTCCVAHLRGWRQTSAAVGLSWRCGGICLRRYGSCEKKTRIFIPIFKLGITIGSGDNSY